MSYKRNAILISTILIFSIVFAINSVSANSSPTGSENVSTVRTINSNQTINNTPIDEDGNVVWLGTGERSQSRLIYGGIISILIMQMIILVLIIQCRKHRTYILKPKSE